MTFRRASSSEFLPKLETSSDRSREVPNTFFFQCGRRISPDWRSFLLRTGVGTLHITEDSRYSAFSLDAGGTRGLLSSSSSSETAVLSERTIGLLSSSSSKSCGWAGYVVFLYDKAKVKCFVGRTDRSRDFCWHVRQVKSNTMCPIAESSAGEEYKSKARHVILSPFEFSSTVIPQFFICGREKRTGTSPVSSTSTLVEHGGVVGKWIVQFSKQVSVSELANTKDLMQGQNSVVMP